MNADDPVPISSFSDGAIAAFARTTKSQKSKLRTENKLNSMANKAMYCGRINDVEYWQFGGWWMLARDGKVFSINRGISNPAFDDWNQRKEKTKTRSHSHSYGRVGLIAAVSRPQGSP